MSITADIISFGGSTEPTEQSKFEVTLWKIPGGGDYNNAYLICGYFDDEDSAASFVKKYSYPPEMAESHAFTEEMRLKRKESKK